MRISLTLTLPWCTVYRCTSSLLSSSSLLSPVPVVALVHGLVRGQQWSILPLGQILTRLSLCTPVTRTRLMLTERGNVAAESGVWITHSVTGLCYAMLCDATAQRMNSKLGDPRWPPGNLRLRMDDIHQMGACAHIHTTYLHTTYYILHTHTRPYRTRWRLRLPLSLAHTATTADKSHAPAPLPPAIPTEVPARRDRWAGGVA